MCRPSTTFKQEQLLETIPEDEELPSLVLNQTPPKRTQSLPNLKTYISPVPLISDCIDHGEFKKQAITIRETQILCQKVMKDITNKMSQQEGTQTEAQSSIMNELLETVQEIREKCSLTLSTPIKHNNPLIPNHTNSLTNLLQIPTINPQTGKKKKHNRVKRALILTDISLHETAITEEESLKQLNTQLENIVACPQPPSKRRKASSLSLGQIVGELHTIHTKKPFLHLSNVTKDNLKQIITVAKHFHPTRIPMNDLVNDFNMFQNELSEMVINQEPFIVTPNVNCASIHNAARIQSLIKNGNSINHMLYNKSGLSNPFPKDLFNQMNNIKFTSNISSHYTPKQLFYLNQDPSGCEGHIDGECGYFHLHQGIKLWLFLPYNPQLSISNNIWDLNQLRNENKLKWYLQDPLEIIFIPSGLTHMVISMRCKTIASAQYINNIISEIDTIATWIQVHMHNEETNTTNQLVSTTMTYDEIEALFELINQEILHNIKQNQTHTLHLIKETTTKHIIINSKLSTHPIIQELLNLVKDL